MPLPQSPFDELRNFRPSDETSLASRLKTPQAVETYEKIMIGKQVRRARERLHMTQKQLATKLRTTQSVVARIENGKQNLTVRFLVQLGFALYRQLHVKFL